MSIASILQRKEEREKKKKSFVNNALDILSRTNYASASAFKAFLEGQPQEAIPAAIEGITGRDKTTYGDIFREYDVPGATAAGIAADIFLDPLTYIPVSTISKPLSKIPGVKKGLTALRETPVVQELGKAFVPGFRPSGVGAKEWNILQGIRTEAKNIMNYGTKQAYDFSMSVQKDLQSLLKKSRIQGSDLVDLIDSVEKRKLSMDLPSDVSPVFNELINYTKEITAKRRALGKSVIDGLNDEDLHHFLRSLSDEKLKELQKTGFDVSARLNTTKTPSDAAREYRKYVEVGNPENVHIGTIDRLGSGKLVPFMQGLKGISQGQLGSLFESTIKDLDDLKDVAKTYGIRLSFSPKARTLGRAIGYFQPKGRVFRIATGGRPQEEWISTVSHELAHVIHGEIGSYSALWSRPAREIGKGGKVVLPKGAWGRILDKMTKLSGEAKEKIFKDLGYSQEFIAKNKRYLNSPTEVFARFMQIVKDNPTRAREISPDLYNLSLSVFRKDRISRKARNIFLSPVGFGERVNAQNLFKDIKTGRMYVEKLASRNEIESKFPGMFSRDIPKLTFLTGSRLAKAEAGTKFMNSVKELGSSVRLPGWVASNAPELKGFYFNPQIQKEIDRTISSFTNEESTKQFLKFFDTVQRGWKISTLFAAPAYHFRNIVGNVWNNWLGGVSNPKYYQQAAKIQTKSATGKALTETEAKILEAAKKSGILGKTFFGAEGFGLEKVPTLTEKAGQALSAPFRAGMKVGSALEDNAKLAHFIAKLPQNFKNDDVVKAALSVKKYLFDYSDLTDFERNVLRRFFPFYSWTRNNLPLQVEALFKQTGKPLALEKTRTELAKASGQPPEELLPKYVQQRYPFFAGKSGKEYRYFPMESFIPFADVYKLNRLGTLPGEMLSPLIKTPIELSTNRSWYFDRNIEEYPGQTKEFLRVDMPARMHYLASSVRLLNDLSVLLGKGARAKEAPPEPNLAERLVRLGTGVKLSRLDMKKAFKSISWEAEQDIKALTIGMKRSLKYGRESEAKRIMERLKTQKENLEILKQKAKAWTD